MRRRKRKKTKDVGRGKKQKCIMRRIKMTKIRRLRKRNFKNMRKNNKQTEGKKGGKELEERTRIEMIDDNASLHNQTIFPHRDSKKREEVTAHAPWHTLHCDTSPALYRICSSWARAGHTSCIVGRRSLSW